MSLTNCPECKKEISNKAQTCPHCGAPTNFSQPVLGGFFESPTRTIIFLLVCLALLVSRCGEDKKEAANPVLSQTVERPTTSITPFGEREVVGSGAWYNWNGNWYGMTFDEQREVTIRIFTLEKETSQGKIKHVHIDFNGEHVAEATPNGGVRVLKSRP